MDVNGECETKYVINSDRPSSSSSSVSKMIVTKVKNFDKCLSKNSFEQGLFADLPHFESERASVYCCTSNNALVSEKSVILL